MLNRAVDARSFHPQDLPASQLSHVYYAFAKVDDTTGEVYIYLACG